MNGEQETIKSLLAIKEESFNGETVQAINAENLHKFLEVKTPFHKWIKKRINEYDLRLDIDFWTFQSETSRLGGRPKAEYYLSLDTAKELSMVERGNKGKEARQYFIACEKKLKEVIAQKPKQIEAGEETAKFFNNFLEDVSRFSPTARQVVAADVAKKIYGIEVPYTALPPADERYSATELAQKISEQLNTEVTPNFIGRLINKLNLRREPYATKRLSKAKHCNKEIEQYFYKPVVLEEISKYLTN